MKRESLKQIYLVTGLACILLIMPIAQVGAATVGFNLVITPRVGFLDPNFGTGVSVSDTFVGTVFSIPVT